MSLPSFTFAVFGLSCFEVRGIEDFFSFICTPLLLEVGGSVYSRKRARLRNSLLHEVFRSDRIIVYTSGKDYMMPACRQRKEKKRKE